MLKLSNMVHLPLFALKICFRLSCSNNSTHIEEMKRITHASAVQFRTNKRKNFLFPSNAAYPHPQFTYVRE